MRMPSATLHQAILQLQQVRNFLDMPQTTPQVLEKVETILRLSREIAFEVHRPVAQRPSDRDIWESLAVALVSFARAERSARLKPRDLKVAIEDHVVEEFVPFWQATHAPTIVGLLRYEPEVMKLLTAAGVLAFGYEIDRDAEWRIINTRWRTSPADIHAWVLGERPAGDRCAFCNLQENPHVNSLLPVEIRRRNGLSMIGDIVVRQTGSVLTHEHCRPFWIDWAAIAAKYEAAQRGRMGLSANA